MTGCRLSKSAFRMVMNSLRSDQAFRRLLLSDSPGMALLRASCVSEADASCLAAIRWEAGPDRYSPIDEKLVLCSSSGY